MPPSTPQHARVRVLLAAQEFAARIRRLSVLLRIGKPSFQYVAVKSSTDSSDCYPAVLAGRH